MPHALDDASYRLARNDSSRMLHAVIGAIIDSKAREPNADEMMKLFKDFAVTEGIVDVYLRAHEFSDFAPIYYLAGIKRQLTPTMQRIAMYGKRGLDY